MQMGDRCLFRLRNNDCGFLRSWMVAARHIISQEAADHKTIAMLARYAHMDHASLYSGMAVLNRKKAADSEAFIIQ